MEQIHRLYKNIRKIKQENNASLEEVEYPKKYIRVTVSDSK